MDFENVLEIIVRETKGIPEGYVRETKGYAWRAERIHLQKKPTQSSVADFIDTCNKHFKEVKVLRAIYKDVPNEGDVKRYAMYAAAKGILAEFDEYARACMHEEGTIDYWETRVESDITKGLLKVMRERSLSIRERRFSIRERRLSDMKLRKMKEIYQEVMEEMGLLEEAELW